MESPYALSDLLTWPKALEHFEFTGLYSTSFYWDFHTLELALVTHGDSLKTLRLGSLRRGGQEFLDMAKFPHVEFLHVSAYVLTCSPEMACSKLLAARVRTFVWDFTIEDQHSESWTEFGPVRAQWLHRFACLAIAHKTSLRRIRIVFNPDYWDERADGLEYPWDLMDLIRDAIKPQGIDLSYSEPRISRKEFLRKVEEAEAERVRKTRAEDISKHFPH